MKGYFTYPLECGGVALERFRHTESAMGGVKATWQLMGNGAVGSQALVGIPCVHLLRFDPELAPHSAVWPFETGFVEDPVGGRRPFVLHAEIWPGIVEAAALEQEIDEGAIRDQAQVRLMCRWAQDEDRGGTLARWLAPPIADAGVRAAAEREEGWILGCPAPTS